MLYRENTLTSLLNLAGSSHSFLKHLAHNIAGAPHIEQPKHVHTDLPSKKSVQESADVEKPELIQSPLNNDEDSISSIFVKSQAATTRARLKTRKRFQLEETLTPPENQLENYNNRHDFNVGSPQTSPFEETLTNDDRPKSQPYVDDTIQEKPIKGNPFLLSHVISSVPTEISERWIELLPP